jgi:hypothetical protein
MKRSNRCTLVLLVGGGVAALAAAGLLARPSGATVADTTCPADVIATFTNVSQPTVPIGVTVVRSFTLPASYAVSAVHLSAPDGYNATQIEEKNGAYGLQLTAPRAGAFTVQATWSEAYMIDNPDGTNAPATCSGVGSVTLTAVRPPAAASASKLPAEGIWSYDNTATVKPTEGNAVFRAYLRVIPGKSNIYSLSGAVLGGTCKRKDGRTLPAGGMAYSAVRTIIPVKPNGSFSATRNALGDAAGVKGTVTVKGVFAGTHVSGTITAHLLNPVYGDCKATGKFFRAKGVQIG